jgi:hypothetical protein
MADATFGKREGEALRATCMQPEKKKENISEKESAPSKLLIAALKF